MSQTDFWSVDVSTDYVLDHGSKSRRCDQCEGIEVGWAIGSPECYLCKKTGGAAMETCIRCGCGAHVRGQVFVDGVGAEGHHVVHAEVKWVELEDGEVVRHQCRGVHPGRWVGGMCPTCCCEVARSQMKERGGGWVSEVVQERMQRMEELVAFNVSCTMQRGGGSRRARARAGSIHGGQGVETGRPGGQDGTGSSGIGAECGSVSGDMYDGVASMEVDAGELCLD